MFVPMVTRVRSCWARCWFQRDRKKNNQPQIDHCHRHMTLSSKNDHKCHPHMALMQINDHPCHKYRKLHIWNGSPCHGHMTLMSMNEHPYHTLVTLRFWGIQAQLVGWRVGGLDGWLAGWVRLIPKRRFDQNHFENTRKGGSPEKEVRPPTKNKRFKTTFLHPSSISLKWHICVFSSVRKTSYQPLITTLNNKK